MNARSRLTSDQLTAVRRNTNWRQLFDALHIQKDPKKSKDHDWWGKSPFNPEENTASFHMNARGWFCHSTGQGGGPLELLQCLNPGMNCYEAGRWLLERGISRIVESVREDVEHVSTDKEPQADSEKEDVEESDPEPKNPPIRQDLRPQLQAEHVDFTKRGIPPRVLHELGAGYLNRPTRKNGKPDPMNRRLVFQIRGVREDAADNLLPVVLGHIGRATTEEQVSRDGKWWTYAGFRKSLELYNLDLAVREETAREQAHQTGWVLVVEGCFDVAKLRAAGIHNVVATFGAHLSARQVERLRFLTAELGIEQVRIFYDRDEAGTRGTAEAMELLANADLIASAFNWERTWSSENRTEVAIPPSIADPADFSPGQLAWLRREGLI